MTLEADIEALRQLRDVLANEAEPALIRRYDTRPPLEILPAYGRLRRHVGDVLRALRLLPPIVIKPWLPGLGRGGDEVAARPLVIWGVGSERETLREACCGFRKLQERLPGVAPVLITDVADFAFFSRLRWLVEYVPDFAPPAERYRDRKLRYLAHRYRDAPWVPAAAGLSVERDADVLCRSVLKAG